MAIRWSCFKKKFPFGADDKLLDGAVTSTSSSVLLLGTFLIAAFCFMWIQRMYPNDDCFIHLRIVHNMVEYRQFTYNLNEPTFATTSPLWNLFVAGICILVHIFTAQLDYLLCSQIIAFFLVILLSIVVFRCVQKQFGWWAWFPAGLIALDPYMTGVVASAMDLPLFALLAVLV